MEETMYLFKKRCEKVVCRDILGCDISTPEGKKEATEDHLFGKFCVDAVANAAQTLADLDH